MHGVGGYSKCATSNKVAKLHHIWGEMLHVGTISVQKLIEGLKPYLRYYAREERRAVRVPFKCFTEQFYGVFVWLANQWVFIGIEQDEIDDTHIALQ